MFAPEFKVAPVARRLAAATLVLWLAGAGCFFGCETVTASAAARRAEQPPAHSHQASSGHSSGHGCSRKAKGEVARSLRLQGARVGADIRQAPGEKAENGCCPLSRRSSEPARGASLKFAPPDEPAGRLACAAQARAASPPPPYRVLVPDRGSTRLLGCVFLI